MGLRVAELETLFTADTRRFDQSADQVEARQRGLDGSRSEIFVDAVIQGALSELAQVESEARSIPDTEIRVDADTSAAQGALDDLGDEAGQAGADAGEAAGSGLAGKILAAIATIPVAGAIVGIGAAIGDALMSGLDNEVREDELAAKTGLDQATVSRLGRIAGEAYANNFGESIRGNMDTARVAIQAGLLDPNATKRDAQAVIESLSGVSDIIGEEIPAVTRATMQLLRTGMAKDAAAAFDIIVKGQQAGLNVSEDWLDTLNEYSTQWRKLGLEGPQAMGLMQQALRGGARDTDLAADALKEFSIRAIDGTEGTALAFEGIGLSAQDMTAKIAAGGPVAAEALGLTLQKLREVEDPALRAQYAVGLFGTQAEDLGDALYAMDLSTAVQQLGTVEGAAKSAIATLGDNTAGQIATAQRNIEVAADGIKGALAAAFGEPIGDFANAITQNREGVMQFLLDVANGAIDAGRTLVEAGASATEGFGDFVSTVGPNVMNTLNGIVQGLGHIGLVSDEEAQNFQDFTDASVKSMEDFDKTTERAADAIRENLIEKGLDPAQERLNNFGLPLVAEAAVHDASLRLAASIDGIGYSADGSKVALEGLVTSTETTTTASGLLDEQIRSAVAALDEETQKAREAGETQEELTQRYNTGRDALINQLTAMGLTQAQAEQLADAYGAVPGKVETVFEAETTAAQADVDAFIARNQGKRIRLTAEVSPSGNPVYVTAGGARFEAAGDVLTAAGAVPMSGSMAQMVPPGTLRVVGDRLDVPELFAPLDGSPRSWALLMEGFRRMPGVAPMASGGLLSRSEPTSSAALAAALDGVQFTLMVEGQPIRAIAHAAALDVVRSSR